MKLDIIGEPKDYRGFSYQEFMTWTGELVCVNLYDKEGWFVAEFPDLDELKHFVDTLED